MERSLAVDALSEGNSAGFGFLKRTPSSILNAAFFFYSPKHENVAQTGQALVFRYVHSPIEFSRLGKLHLGGSFSYRINAKPDETEFLTRPEVATADDYYVDTGAIDFADKVMRGGLEANKQAGRFSWQSELLMTRVQRQGRQKLSFWGAYTYVSWFLTDDSRNYDAGTGEFNAVVPSHPLGKGGKGAFELALRASYVDLTDKDVIGGEQSNITLGLNWYINKHFRLMTNLVKVLDVKRPGSEYDGLDPLIFSLRFQWLML
jgi:phosphate-selective porin OprO/OprP